MPVKKEPEVKKDTVVKDTATPPVQAEPVVVSPVREEMIVEGNVEEETPYHVIVGSFKNRQRAEQLKNRMVQLGFKDTQIFQNEEGLFRVSCGVFKTHDEAWDKVFEIRKAYPKHRDVWALKVK